MTTQQELQLNTARSRVTEITSMHESTERENNQLRKDKSLLVDHVAEIQKKVSIISPDLQFFLRKIVIFFLAISFNMCFWCSKEPSR